MINTLWLFVAAGLSALILIIHLTLGQRDIVRPVLESSLEPEPKWASFLCWHVVTINLILSACGGLAPLIRADLWPMTLFVAVLAGLTGLWSLALSLSKGGSPFFLPQWILFLPIAAASYLGIRGMI